MISFNADTQNVNFTTVDDCIEISQVFTNFLDSDVIMTTDLADELRKVVPAILDLQHRFRSAFQTTLNITFATTPNGITMYELLHDQLSERLVTELKI